MYVNIINNIIRLYTIFKMMQGVDILPVKVITLSTNPIV